MSRPNDIRSDIFDCIILTHTLLCMFDTRSAFSGLHRILKPGGVLLVTIPGICQISRYDTDRWGDYWRFTLFEEAFSPNDITVEHHGNVLVASAFLCGVSVEELRKQELDHNDADYPLVITVRATKRREPPTNS